MLTELDKSILNIIQTKLPVVRRPFAAVAEAIGANEQIVLERIKWMSQNGYIRRMGPFFDSDCLGYVGTLVAVDVQDDQMATVATAINSYKGVTHNYERDGDFNLWFTLLSPTREDQDKILSEIAMLPGIRRINSLPATKKLKVNVEFTLK